MVMRWQAGTMTRTTMIERKCECVLHMKWWIAMGMHLISAGILMLEVVVSDWFFIEYQKWQNICIQNIKLNYFQYFPSLRVTGIKLQTNIRYIQVGTFRCHQNENMVKTINDVLQSKTNDVICFGTSNKFFLCCSPLSSNLQICMS